MARLRPAASAVASRFIAAAALASGGAIAASSCAPDSEPEPVEEQGADGPEPTEDRADSAGSATVADAVKSSCTTAGVKGLSAQIIAEGNCIVPGAYTEVPDLANVSFAQNVFPYLEAPAQAALVEALEANPGLSLHVNSMLRTVAQQYLLYQWYVTGRCGIGLAAKPGNSNHETGLAFDTSNYAAWKSALAKVGFKWLGSQDPPHFDFVGAGAVSHKGVDVEAFQRLWNRNHPEDPIAEDGVWGPQTEARMKKAPAQGFAKGASCGGGEGGGGSTETATTTTSTTTSTMTGTTTGEGGAGGGGDEPPDCGAYEGKTQLTCAPDGNGRGKCTADGLVFESCDEGCLIVDGGEDICMGGAPGWSCGGSWGTAKVKDGDYYLTAFGCWEDEDGVSRGDPGDNCIPACIDEAKQSGLCSGLSGPACEEKVHWYAADAGRFGCLARLRVTNPANGKSVVVVALDLGPSCTVEKNVQHAVFDASYPTNDYLFGEPKGAVEKALVHVVEVDPATPLGPVP